MTIRMLINATARNELRIALVEDGELVELDIEAAEQSTIKGNVYKGIVHNVEPALEAAFVDFGAHKQGFLPFSEVSQAALGRRGEGARVQDVLRRGQEIVVQVAKDAIGEKGATLTTYLSLAGRYTVLMPGSDAGGISRKVEDDKTRKRVKSIAAKVERPEGCGFIVRTAGLTQTRVGIQKDLDAVVAKYEKIQKAAQIARAPSALYSEPDLIARTLRDYFNEEIDEVWIDSPEEYRGAVEYFEDVMPDLKDRLRQYQNPIPIFAYYRVEEQIEATFERQVFLPGGGSIVIDQTEALVAIDVNSGKHTSEKDHEETVFRANCEAATEVARQLKLRDLGGIVVVDFIDMELPKHRREVERILAEAAEADKARYKISKINSKGLLVLTRQRIRQGMRKAFQRRCEVCGGTGWLRTPESHALSLLRRIEARLAQGEVGEVRVVTHKETAEYIQNVNRRELFELERRYGARIVVSARAEMDRGKDDVSFLSKGHLLAEITDRLPPREERRLDRASRRKRKGKKKSTETAAPAAAARGGATSDLPGVAEAQGERKSRRRKKKRGVDERGAPAEGVVESAEGAEPERPAEAPRPQLEAKGSTTFTGRISPEELERLKAERKARLARRASPAAEAAASPVASPADGSPVDGSPVDGSPVDVAPVDVAPVDVAPVDVAPVDVAPVDAARAPDAEPSAEAAPADAVDEAGQRRSLLERIFGAR
jgi:ribonuclease E